MDRYTTVPASEKVEDLTQAAAAKAEAALQGTRRFANDAVDTLQDGVEEARRATASTLHRAAGKLDDLTRRSVDRARDLGSDVRDRFESARDHSADYVRDEPVKSVLMAVAAGAALAVLIGWATRERR